MILCCLQSPTARFLSLTASVLCFVMIPVLLPMQIMISISTIIHHLEQRNLKVQTTRGKSPSLSPLSSTTRPPNFHKLSSPILSRHLQTLLSLAYIHIHIHTTCRLFIARSVETFQLSRDDLRYMVQRMQQCVEVLSASAPNEPESQFAASQRRRIG